MKDPKRMATLDAMRALDNALRSIDRRLKDWRFTEENRQALETALTTGALTKELLALHAGHLVLTSDKGSTQFAMQQFMMWHLGLRCINHWDPAAHGLWNAKRYGLREAGFLTTMMESQILINWRAGV